MTRVFVRNLDRVGTKRFATVAFADANLYIPVSHYTHIHIYIYTHTCTYV